MTDTRSPDQRTLRVCDYVTLDLADIVGRLSTPRLDEVLTTTLRTALEPVPTGVDVSAAPLELLPGGSVRLQVSWRATTAAGHDLVGTARIVALPIQTGSELLTELLVEVAPAGGVAHGASAVAARFLSRLVDWVASARDPSAA